MLGTAPNFAPAMNERQRAIGKRIAEMRERAGLTQDAAADKIGVTLRAYQKWEAGGGITRPNLQRLAELYATTPDKILGPAPPSLFAVEDGVDKLERIEEKLDRLCEAVLMLALGQATQAAQALRAQDAGTPPNRSGSQGRTRGPDARPADS